MDATQCRILLVDDDSDCLGEYAEAVSSLGYLCETATDAREALRLITDDQTIGIVITDVQMPAMDGITFLDELASRFAPLRPIVPIVITGFGSMDCAVQAMRFNAVDFLSKPVSLTDLAASLRRALARWGQMTRQMMPQFAAESSLPPVDQADAKGEVPSKESLIESVRSIIRRRQRRSDFLDSELFADPSWDILLDLTRAKLDGQQVSVSSVCIAASVPMSTALRWVRQMVDAGLLRRWTDPKDRRRDLIALTDTTAGHMGEYLGAVHAMLQKI